MLSNQMSLWKRALLLIYDASPRYTIFWIALLVIQGVLPVMIAYITKFAIDSVAAVSRTGEAAQVANVIWFFALMGIFLLFDEIAQQAGIWVRTAHAEVFGDFIADKVHAKSGEVDLAFYESPEYYDLAEQVRGEAGGKPLAMLESLGSVIQSSISMIGLGALLLTYGWWLGIVLLAGALPSLYLTFVADRQYHSWWRSTAEDRRWTSYYDAMLTHANAAAEMRLFGLNLPFRTLYQSIKGRIRSQKLRHIRKQIVGKILASGIALGVGAAAIIWMATRVFYGFATLGDLGVFYQIFSRGQGLVRSLFTGVGKTLNNSLYLENLFAFFDLQPNIVSGRNGHQPVAGLREGINFRSVKFNYPGSETPALTGLDLFVPADKVVALVGVNGAGKSTLIKLLCRFYDPTEGSIELDGVNLKDLDVSHVRRMMSVLFQFPMQYHASAKENIAFGDLAVEGSDADVFDAARKAGADGFINRLPKQYDSLLGKWFVSGTELSGGEWQRLALARAYYRRSPIVILDEPTSMMDSWSEGDWFDRFRDLAFGRTGIIITHRFTVAMRADIIHVIDGGRIVESGTHRELLENDRFYAESWRNQMLAADKAPAAQTVSLGSQ